MIRGLIPCEIITVNMYISNTGATKYVKQIIYLKEELESNVIVVGMLAATF